MIISTPLGAITKFDRDCCRYLDFLDGLQVRNSGRPVVVSPSFIESETGLDETTQIFIRQRLMRAGRLRLRVELGRWAYDVSAERGRHAHPVE